MRFSQRFAAVLLFLGILVQGPALSNHALAHALDQIHDHSDHSPGAHLTVPECGLCDTFQAQSSIVAVACFQELAPVETSSEVVATPSDPVSRRLAAFRSRAPPEA